MKILICSNIYPPKFIGGAEIIAHRQGQAFKKLGHDVRVFAGDIRDIGPRHHHLREVYDGLPVDRVRLTHEDFAEGDVNFVHQPVEDLFIDLIETFRPDVVHCHNLIGLSVNLPIIAKNRGCKVIVTLHDHWGYCFKNTAEREPGVLCTDHRDCAQCMPYIGQPARRLPIEARASYVRHALDHADRLISPSQYLADKYVAVGFPEEKTLALWNGIDIDKFAPRTQASGEVTRFSFFGYIGRHKGLDVLLRAAALLPRPDMIEINLVGEGDREPSLRALADELGISKQVRFWGKLDNDRIGEALDETDVLVLPSIWPENQPVSITEAMASGLPVIASDIGGIPELVRHEQTGLTFEMGNPTALSEQMLRLVEDPTLRSSLGAAGRAVMEKHSFALQVGKLLRIYQDIVPSETSRSQPDIAILVGDEVEPDFAEGLRVLTRLYPEYPVVTALDEWLVEEDRVRAIMACAMDRNPPLELMRYYQESGLPLITSAQSEDADPTLSADAVQLTYRTADDVAGSMAFIARAAQAVRSKG